MTTYTENFSGSSPLDNWSEPWVGNLTLNISSSSQAAKVGSSNLRAIKNTGDGYDVTVFDTAGSISGDVEVLALLDLDDFTTYFYTYPAYLWICVGGSSGSEDGYAVRVSKNDLTIGKIVSGSWSDLVQDADYTISSGSPQVWIRFQKSSTTLRCKIWNYDAFEPSEWILSTTDSDHSSGYVGIGCYTNVGGAYWDYFAADDSATIAVPTLTVGGDPYRCGICRQTVPVTCFTPTSTSALVFNGFYVTAEMDGQYLTHMAVYGHSNNPRWGVYVGSDISTPVGATLIEDLGQNSLTTSTWDEIALSTPYQVSEGDVIWLGLKSSGYVYRTGAEGEAQNFMLNGHGRQYLSSGGDSADPTDAWDATVTGTFTNDDYWYAMYGVFSAESVTTTTTTTTTTVTVSTTTETTSSTSSSTTSTTSSTTSTTTSTEAPTSWTNTTLVIVSTV